MAMKLYITVTEVLGTKEFEMITDVDPDLPWHDFIKAINLHRRLDSEYPDWQGYDIDIDDEYAHKTVKAGIIKPPEDTE